MKKILFTVLLGFCQLFYCQTDFVIVPPKGWTSFSKGDIERSLDQKYTVSDAKKEEMIKNKSSVEIVRFMTRSKDGTYSPNLQVLLRPNGTKTIDELKAAVEKSLEGFKNVIGDFKVTQPLTKISVDGKEALIFRNEGYLKTKTDQKNYFRTILLVIPNGETFYQITLNDTKNDSYEKEFKEVIASIRF